MVLRRARWGWRCLLSSSGHPQLQRESHPPGSGRSQRWSDLHVSAFRLLPLPPAGHGEYGISAWTFIHLISFISYWTLELLSSQGFKPYHKYCWHYFLESLRPQFSHGSIVYTPDYSFTDKPTIPAELRRRRRGVKRLGVEHHVLIWSRGFTLLLRSLPLPSHSMLTATQGTVKLWTCCM